MQKHFNRESWLTAAIHLIKPLFEKKGYQLPECLVSCGFASTGNKSGHIGQCWARDSSELKVNQIFVSPTLVEPVEVLDTLTHELVHAVDDCQHKHGKEFKKICTRMGLKGPMRSAGAGPELKEKLQEIAFQLGPYPHGKLMVSMRKITRSPRPRARCTQCAYEVPMYKKFLAYGPPICPIHKSLMKELGDWEDY
jgi:hypothetical protein